MGTENNSELQVESKMYDLVCKKRFDALETSISDNHSSVSSGLSTLDKTQKETNVLIKEMDKRLFKGNGQPSITVQIDRLNQAHKRSEWYRKAFIVMLLGIVAFLIRNQLKENFYFKKINENQIQKQVNK